MNGDHDERCDCDETAEVYRRLDAAGVEYTKVSLSEVMASNEPLFFMPKL